MVGLPEFSWEDQPKMEEQLRQHKDQEKDQLISSSNLPPAKLTKK
jgi:hypothetical protein